MNTKVAWNSTPGHCLSVDIHICGGLCNSQGSTRLQRWLNLTKMPLYRCLKGFLRLFGCMAENSTRWPKMRKKSCFQSSNWKITLTPPPEECLNFSNLGGIRSKSSGGPQLTGQTFLVKLRLICLVLVRILTKTRQISRNLTRKVCPVSWGPPDDLDLIPPRFEKFKHSSGGGVRVIFQFEDWKHDFLRIFGQRVEFSAIQPKSLRNPLRQRYRGILVKLSHLWSLVDPWELQRPPQMCISTERQCPGVLFHATFVFIMSIQTKKWHSEAH